MAEEYNDEDSLVAELPDYSKKSEYNKPKQAETVINKALASRAEPMHPEYVNTSVSSDGSIKRERVKDSRESYVNSVKAALICLNPELNRKDDETIKSYKEKIDKALKEEETIFKKYSYIDLDYNATWNADKMKWQFNRIGEPFIAEYDQIVRIPMLKPGKNGEVESIKGYCNQQNKLYWIEMIKISDKILCELQNLADNLNYFKQESSF